MHQKASTTIIIKALINTIYDLYVNYNLCTFSHLIATYDCKI